MSIANITRTNPVLVNQRTTDVHDEYWFPEVYRHMPKGIKEIGMMTALIAGNKKMTRTNSRSMNWWEKGWNQRNTAVTDVFNGPGLATATSSASASGVSRTIQMAANDAKKWEQGHMVAVWKFNEAGLYKTVGEPAIGLVTGKSINGSSSYITVTLQREDTDNVLSGTYLKLGPAGQKHPDIHTLPNSSFEDLTKIEGAQSTFLGAFELNDFERLENTRPNYDITTECRKDAFKNFQIDKELAFLHSIFDGADPTYQSTGGMEYYLSNYQEAAGRNIIDAASTTTYLSTETGPAYTWIYTLLENFMEYSSRWNPEKTWDVFHGGQAGLVINQMIRDAGQWNLGQTKGVDTYGLKFTQLDFQNGSLRFREHPLFKTAEAYQGQMVIVNPEYVEQATFVPFEEIPADLMNAERASRARRDGTNWSSVSKGGFREVCGWKFCGVNSMAIIRNVHTKVNR